MTFKDGSMAQAPQLHLHLARYIYEQLASASPIHHKESSRIAISSSSSSKPIKKLSCAVPCAPTSSRRATTTATTTSDNDDDENVMGNSLRCCLACMVPCGALDVVRIVHLSGHVDEFSCPVAAATVLAANPNHTLTTAWSPSGAPGGCGSRKLVIVSPDSELKRGRIYFLIPSATLPADRRSKKHSSSSSSSKKSSGGGGGKRPSHQSRRHHHHSSAKKSAAGGDTAEQDNYLTELLAEKTASSGHRRRRSGARVGVWRPRLESIVEEASD